MNGIEQLVIGTMVGVVGAVGQPLPEDLKSEAVECLALNMYHEARGQGTAGELAVTTVVMNRVNDSRFPNTICGVVKQGPTRPSWKDPKILFPIKHKCQFSWYCDGKLDVPPTSGSLWKDSREVARYVLSTPDLMDITDGATHYHADYISSPRWADPRRKTAQIDTHIFYNKARKNLTKLL